MEWFYAKNNQQFGPVTAGELVQLARRGELTPDDLVWRQGMEHWSGAGRVKGLFEGEPLSPTPEPTAASNPPSATPKGIPAVRPPAAHHTPAVPEVARVERFEPPAALKESGPRGVFAGTPPEPRRATPTRHLLDYLLDTAKRSLSVPFVEATAHIFRGFGHFGLYAAMGVATCFGALALREPGLRLAAILVLAAIPLLALLQYVAQRFLDALERLNRATPGRLDSSAVLDCLALLTLFLATAALIVLAIQAGQTHQVSLILQAVAVFILGQYLAVLAINPGVLCISVGSSGGAGEEALALLSCLLKMLTVGLVPVAFGVGIVCGTVQLIYAIVVQLLAVQGEALPDPTTAIQAIGLLCGSALVPVLAYLLFLALHLGIDVLRGLIHLANLGEDPAEPDPQETRV